MRKLSKLAVTSVGGGYVVRVEDDTGLAIDLGATLEQLLAMGRFERAPANAVADARSAVEDAEEAVEQATDAKDVHRLRDLLSPDVLINSPANKVIGRDQMLEMTAKGEMTYSEYVRTTDAFSLYGPGLAAVMGEERFSHADPAFGTGPVIRRYTDVWAKEGAGWKLIVRQATYTPDDDKKSKSV